MKQKLIEEAGKLEPDPPRSKLDDYAEVIWELRRKRKRICTIAQFLTRHGVRISKSSVARWLKTHPLPLKPSNATPHSASTDNKAAEFFQNKPNDSNDHEPKTPYNLGL